MAFKGFGDLRQGLVSSMGFVVFNRLRGFQRTFRPSRDVVALMGLYGLQEILWLWCLQRTVWLSVDSVSFNRFFGPEVVSWPSMALRPSTGFAAFKSFVDYKVFCAVRPALQPSVSFVRGIWFF